MNGTALGGGFEIALSCDLIVAAEHAIFGLPEVKRGLIAGAGGLIRVGRLLPRPLALELAMTGEPISAARAQELGLVSRVTPAAALLDTALSLAELIASNSPLAVRLSKELVTAAPDLTMDEAWARSDALSQQIMGSEDMREGLQAFAEKRRPNWKGRWSENQEPRSGALGRTENRHPAGSTESSRACSITTTETLLLGLVLVTHL